jgi:hypothetical protein
MNLLLGAGAVECRAPERMCFGVHAGEGGSKLPTLQGADLTTLDNAGLLAPFVGARRRVMTWH